MATIQEAELWRRQLVDEKRQLSTNAAKRGRDRTHRSCENDGTVGVKTAEDMRVGVPEPYVLGQDSDDWGSTLNGSTGTLDPAHPNLLNARQSTTVVIATAPHDRSLQHCCTFSRCTQKGARKVVRKAGNNGFEAYRQLCLTRNVRSGGQHGRADHDK